MYNLYLQANGLTERFNQTLVRCLGKLANDDQTDWDVKIDVVLMGYRASCQASTKHSPYYMLYQKEMRLPIDVEVEPFVSETEEDLLQEGIEQKLKTLLESRDKVFGQAAANITAAQTKQKEQYDKKHLQKKEIPLESQVLVENTRQKQRKGGKLQPRWLGPYAINKAIGKGVYELKSTKGKVLKTKVNATRLKIFSQREGI